MAQFLVFTVLMIAMYMAFIKTLWSVLKYDGLLSAITNGWWDKYMDKLYNKGSNIEKMLGGCEKCTAFWWGMPYTVLYVYLSASLKLWPFSYVGGYLWSMVYWFTLATAGLWALTYKTKEKEDGM